VAPHYPRQAGDSCSVDPKEKFCPGTKVETGAGLLRVSSRHHRDSTHSQRVDPESSKLVDRSSRSSRKMWDSESSVGLGSRELHDVEFPTRWHPCQTSKPFLERRYSLMGLKFVVLSQHSVIGGH